MATKTASRPAKPVTLPLPVPPGASPKLVSALDQLDSELEATQRMDAHDAIPRILLAIETFHAQMLDDRGYCW